MGAYLDKPITEKENEDGADHRTAFGVSSMQGWRKEVRVYEREGERGAKRRRKTGAGIIA